MDSDKHGQKWNAQLLTQERISVQEDLKVFLPNSCVNVKIKDIRSYVLSTGFTLELEPHGVTGGGKVKEVLEVAVEDAVGRALDVVVDKVAEVICRGAFLRGPELITFQSEEEEEEEEEAVAKK